MMIIQCDPGKISQVLFNLLDNALKFTDQGQIVVSIDYNNKSNNGSNMMTHLSPAEEYRTEQIIVIIKDTGKEIYSSITDYFKNLLLIQ